NAALHLIAARLGDHVHDAAGRTAELGIGAVGDHLELLDGFERDVDGRALSAHLLAKEAVVVISAVETDVVEHAALAREGDLIAVWPLHDADAGRQRHEVLELATENGRVAD